MNRLWISSATHHLFSGGILKVDDILIYIDNEGNVKGLSKIKRDEKDNYKATHKKRLLDDYDIKTILGRVDENFLYEEIDYNNLSINYLIRQLQNAENVKFM